MPRTASLLIVLFLSVLQATAVAAQVGPGNPTGQVSPGGGIPSPSICNGECPPPFSPMFSDGGDGGSLPSSEERRTGPRVVRIGVFGPPELVISGPFGEFDAATAALQEAGGHLAPLP